MGGHRAVPSTVVAALCLGTLALSACASSGSSASSTPPASQGAPQGAAHAATREIAVHIGSPPLPGTLVLPAGNGPFPAIVMVSGSGPNDRDETTGVNHPFRDLAGQLAARGIATLRYDKRTKVYGTQIDLATFTPTQEYVPDAVAAISLLQQRSDIDPHRIVVLGHSQGGTFAPRIAATDHSVAGVILLAAAAAPFGATIVRQAEYLSAQGVGNAAAQLGALRDIARLVDNPNLPRSTPPSRLLGSLGAPYWLDLTHYDAVGTARSLAVPILVLQGGRDYQVTIADDLSRWERGLAGRPRVTEKRYPDADHLFFAGTGASTPREYQQPHVVEPAVAADIARWMGTIRRS